MSTETIGLLQALGAKMNYLDQRQRLIAQNVANADTPDFQPRDLLPVDFSTVLRNVTETPAISPVTTNTRHMPAPNLIPDGKERDQKTTYESAPAGNAVIIEEQMVNASHTAMDYNLMASLYQKNIGMFRTVLGRGQ